MPLNSHRRYQKAHIEVNHERGCLFEHILVPTLPEFQNKLGELRQRTPARCKGPQDRLLITRHVFFLQVTAINKHDFLAAIENNRDFPLSRQTPERYRAICVLFLWLYKSKLLTA